MKTSILGFFLLCTLSSVAHAGDTFSKLECHKVKGANVCKVVKAPKISDSITYLDMSETEGKGSDLPTIAPKGKL